MKYWSGATRATHTLASICLYDENDAICCGGIMFIYCHRFLFEKFNLFKLIFSSEMSSSRSLSDVQVRTDLSLISLEPQISKANNTNNCHLKFKFTDYFNNCSKNPFVKSLSRCLKITEKVSFNIVSEANYVYILSGRKLIKNAKIGPFWRVFENRKRAVK